MSLILNICGLLLVTSCCSCDFQKYESGPSDTPLFTVNPMDLINPPGDSLAMRIIITAEQNPVVPDLVVLGPYELNGEVMNVWVADSNGEYIRDGQQVFSSTGVTVDTSHSEKAIYFRMKDDSLFVLEKFCVEVSESINYIRLNYDTLQSGIRSSKQEVFKSLGGKGGEICLSLPNSRPTRQLMVDKIFGKGTAERIIKNAKIVAVVASENNIPPNEVVVTEPKEKEPCKKSEYVEGPFFLDAINTDVTVINRPPSNDGSAAFTEEGIEIISGEEITFHLKDKSLFLLEQFCVVVSDNINYMKLQSEDIYSNGVVVDDSVTSKIFKKIDDNDNNSEEHCFNRFPELVRQVRISKIYAKRDGPRIISNVRIQAKFCPSNDD